MKKSKKREYTLEQLQKKEKVANKITKAFFKIGLILIIICLVIEIFWIKDDLLFLLIYIKNIISTVLWCVITLTINVIKENYQYQIEKKQKISKIREMAQKGNLKNALNLIIKDKNTIVNMLVKDIETIVYKGIEDTSLIVDIYFKKNFTILTLKIPMEEVLDDTAIKVVLENYIDTIKIENSEKEKLKVSILGEGFCYENEEVTEDDLLEMFELKENE